MRRKLEVEDREFYNELLKIAIPVMVQQFIIVAVQLCDTIMVGNLGEEALAAVGAANQVFIVYIDSIFGFLSGVAVFSAQYWGIHDLQALRKLLGIGYTIVTIFGIIVTVIVFFGASFWIGLFSDDPQVVALGTDYIRIAVFTYLIGAMTFVISYNSRVVARLKWPTIINAFAVVVNIYFNWCLIYGHCGFPKLGVEGAAIATLIARAIEFAMTYIYVYKAKSHPLQASFPELCFDKELLLRVLRTALPVVLNEILWVLGFTTVFAIYGKISAVALAVVQVAMTVTDIFQAIYCGLSNSCTVIVGKTLGQGNRQRGYEISVKCLKIAWILNLTCTVTFILLRDLLVGIYDFNESTNVLLLQTMLVYAVAITPKMLAYVYICGILRPGGDTIWTAFVDAGINWMIQVPLAWVSVVILQLELPYCIALVALADCVKAIVCHLRFRTKKWINIFTGK